MTITSLATLGSLALLLAASAYGQDKLAADIPFEFQVGGVVLPAGHYEVARVYANDQFMLALKGDTARAMFLTNNGSQTMPAQSGNELVFNKYGEKRFLSMVISAGYVRKLNESKQEREIAYNKPPASTEQVLLAQR